MAIMEVTLQQTFQNQECINRWNYLASGTPAAVSFSFALVSALGAIESAGVYPATGMMSLIGAVQTTSVSFNVITVKNVYSVTDFYSTPFTVPLTGAIAGEGMPPFAALGFRTNRTRSDIQRATKRFVGVSELWNNNGNFITGTAAAEALSAKMSEVLTYDDEGNTLSFAPIVVSKEKYDPNPEDPTRPHVAYRYYPTESEQLDHIATSILWQHYSTIRGQASRQFGKGR